MMKSTLKLTILLLCSLAMANQILAEKPVIINSDQIPQDFPLRLVDPKATELGTVLDWENKPFTLALKNVANHDVTIQRMMITCSCTTLDKPFEKVTLKPQETFTWKMYMSGQRLSVGSFEKEMYIQLDKRQLAMIQLRGIRKDAVILSPAKSIDLGACSGDITWTRSFTIKSTFPQGKLKLLPPLQDKMFTYTLKQLNPQEYQLSFTPRELPLPIKNYRRMIELETQGVDNYGPIVLPIQIRVTGHIFHLVGQRLVINPDLHSKDKAFETHTEIRYGARRSRRMPRRGSYRSLISPDQAAEVIALPVAKEEEQARPLNEKKTWEMFAKHFSATTSKKYPTVKISIVPQDDHAKLVFHFPENFFKQNPHGLIRTKVKYKDGFFGRLYVNW